MHGRNLISIWFFIGLLVLAYGLVILAAGIFEGPGHRNVVLAELRADLWWGVLLTVVGAFYTIRFRPGKQ